MFRYQDTKKLSVPGEIQHKVVTEVRQVTYINNDPDPKAEIPLTTVGFETVKEEVRSPGSTFVPIVVGSKTVDNRKEEKPKFVKKSY